MGKKKNKIAKLTKEQYFAYIAGLKHDAALFDANGNILIPSSFKTEDIDENRKEGD